MTEEFKKWALEKAGGSFVYESEEAEFWIRAFCDELEKRVETDFLHGYTELKREFLGDD